MHASIEWEFNCDRAVVTWCVCAHCHAFGPHVIPVTKSLPEEHAQPRRKHCCRFHSRDADAEGEWAQVAELVPQPRYFKTMPS
jgi:hypothetical protein